ncbi:MAG: ribosomal L7Ae/L30e/S12e/Gadd45 family protein [Firmicutes bacterium]|nr:ribosomal L7Ae/L30e/S12e/Gadd45 family protein [Bacillota bacterium]
MNPSAVLGFARAAGQVASGDEACRRAVRYGKARLVLVAEDAGAALVRRVRHMAETHGVPVVQWGRKEELGRWVGERPRAVIAVCDPGWANRLWQALGGGETSRGDAVDGKDPSVRTGPRLGRGKQADRRPPGVHGARSQESHEHH